MDRDFASLNLPGVPGEGKKLESRMDIIKKNLFSIIFGVIAILAVGALFWPISGLYTTLDTELQSRVEVSSQLDALVKQQRTMPVLSPEQTTPDPLNVFPIQPVYDAALNATKLVSAQAAQMMDLARKTNERLPLRPDELPKPNDQARYNFSNDYAAQILNYQRWQQLLNSTTPPTAEEIQDAKDKLKAAIYAARLSKDPQGNIDPQSQQDADEQYNAEAAEIEPRMELERAQQHSIYLLMPPTFKPLPIDATINIGSRPSSDQICSAQIAIWVIDDVVNAIVNANNDYSDSATPGGPPQHDILHSAVKSLENIGQPQPVVNPAGFDATAGVSAPAPKITTVSPTGRVCNGLYDVLEFKVDMVVDASKIAQIVHTFEAGQFVTVLNVQVTNVIDPAMAASTNNTQGGYHYGNKPAVEVEFDCEDLFMRQWTDKYLPDDMKGAFGKAQLGQPTNAGAPPQFGPGGPQFGPGGPGGPMGPYGPGGPPGAGRP
jgi:hypothetical protein